MQKYKSFPLRNTSGEFYGNKIIPFSDAVYQCQYIDRREPVLDFPGTASLGVSPKKMPEGIPDLILARPGEKLPDSIPDFRTQLQRNGLILLSWDKRVNEKGERYTAYWVTSSGILRYYASPALRVDDFAQAMPNRKSYAAEDGIDFYGETSPEYIVHVAPELMMSCRLKQIQRPEHIKKLRALGIRVDFDYRFLLTKERIKRRSEYLNKKHA